ncbi:nuclear transport factor 2 family protein [Paenibacillus sp. AR247]|uniref:YybH family protein n=1 Tax=Paenibacillus sp. AR247 TaxID=1631599 RepID=UPI002157C4BE|nr:nuclear transport factor 2 family protein [Paenibacillus sp. AR247]
MKPPAHFNPVMRPEDMNAAFAEAFNSGDINALLTLYEPNSILMNPAGGLDQGIETIRGTLEDLLQLQGRMTSRNIYCIPFENIALLRAQFILQYTGWERQPGSGGGTYVRSDKTPN